MRPAAAPHRARHLVISGIAVRYQAAGIAFQERRRVLSAAVRLVLKETDRPAAPFSAAVDPHPGLRSGGLPVLLQHLDHRLVRIDDSALQQMLFQHPAQRFQPSLGCLDHPVGHGGTAQRYSLPLPDLLLPVQRQTIHIFAHHDVGHRGGGCQTVFQQPGRSLHRIEIGIAALLFAVFAGVGCRVIYNDIDLPGDDLQLSAHKLLSNPFQLITTGLTKLLLLRQFQHDLLHRQALGQLVYGALWLTLALVLLYCQGFFCRFRSLVVLLRLRLVEHPQLVGHHVRALLAALPELRPLRLQQQLVHALQLPAQFFILLFQHSVLFPQLQKYGGVHMRGRSFPSHC